MGGESFSIRRNSCLRAWEKAPAAKILKKANVGTRKGPVELET